jgi:hypothetical protein
MQTERPARPNFLVLTIIGATLILLGIDRIVRVDALRAVATEVYNWAVILAAFGLVLGALNVGWVHVRRILVGQPGWGQSLALVVVMLVIFITGLLSPTGVRSPLVEWAFDSILAPAQATLFALLAFFMAGAAYRFLRVGRTGSAWILAGVGLVLLVQIPLVNALLPPALAAFVGWTVDVPGMAALRGVALGSAFALLIAAFRYLLNAR